MSHHFLMSKRNDRVSSLHSDYGLLDFQDASNESPKVADQHGSGALVPQG
jgi:hypothetical protein